MANETAAIIARGLTRRFGGLTAVDGLDLEVRPGEIFGLVGPDGAGKTTAIRMLATVSPPTSGSAAVLGFDVGRRPEPIKQRIGYMAQQFNLYGDLSVRENLDFFADIFGVSGRQRRQRIPRLLAFARLTEFTDRRAGRLSGGMKKKLALACALVHDPRVLLLDEPTTGVDPVSRREFWDILAGLHIEGVTILASTPYMDEAERCSRVGLMHRGRLIVCDTPERVRQMVDGELIEVRPAQAAMRAAEAALTRLPEVREVQVYGDRLHAFVADAGTAMPVVRRALAEAGVAVEGLRRARPRMEEAYISLIRRQEGGIEI